MKQKPKTNSHSNTSKKLNPTQHVKVLYQNLGGTWYAFADVNDEIFFSPVQLKQTAPDVNLTKTTTPKTRLKASPSSK